MAKKIPLIRTGTRTKEGDRIYLHARKEPRPAVAFDRVEAADPNNPGYKACLVANGNSQQLYVNYDDTFSPIVKPATIRIVLSLAASRNSLVHQLDVKNAFLHGTLSETVYMHQPLGFWDPQRPDLLYLLQRSCESSLFINKQEYDVSYLLLYVDDVLLTASSTSFLHRIIASLHHEFFMTDLGLLNYFLGIFVTRSTNGMFLSQKKYAADILECTGMRNCHSCRTSNDTESKLGADGTLVSDLTLNKNLAGALQYLTLTRLDLSYAV
ncbi:ribonuclease H-like domain-containing protein [Tanacetum coccineum]